MSLYGTSGYNGSMSIGPRDVQDIRDSSKSIVVYTPHNPLECDGKSHAYQAARHVAGRTDYDIFFSTKQDPTLAGHADHVVCGHEDPTQGLRGVVNHIKCGDSGRNFVRMILEESS